MHRTSPIIPPVFFLTEKAAKKIFGNDNPLGQTLQFENLGFYTIGGIIQDPPLETHLPIEALGAINAAEMLERKGAINNISKIGETLRVQQFTHV